MIQLHMIYRSLKSPKSIGLLLVVLMMHSSCKKVLDIDPEQTLAAENMYRNVFDADAAVIGIYGKLQSLAGQYVVLNELRGDLLEVTANASPDLKQVSTHQVAIGNPYADPRPFYEVIFYCNDALKNFDVMLKDKKFTTAEYNSRYADIGAVRSWLYLQLGIHFGTVPYVTHPFEKVEELKDVSKYPRLNFKQLLQELITFTERLPTLAPYPAATSLVTTVDGYSTAKFFVDKQILLGDLYLWNNDYLKAATSYKAVMERYTTSADGVEQFDFYKVRYAEAASNNDLAVGYIRYQEQNLGSLINSNTQGWKSMFARSQDVLWNSEWIWVLPFNKNFAPVNPFIDLFAVKGGKYQVKPSQTAISNWGSQTQQNGFSFDARGLFSYASDSGQPVVSKYTYNYNFLLPLEKTGNWFLYRAALLHLHYAEAANRDHQGKVAWALVNYGIASAYDDAANTDKTNLQQSHEAAPYDFDARYGTAPYFRGPWHRNAGIRGRAYLTPLASALQDDQLGLEDAILNEAGLELAYEGNRWPDLLRIALRRNDASFLADKIGDKLEKDGYTDAAAVRARLLDKANWYLPFNW
ncbi:RagB/SusD family nutrient uptake outer membrane protein [Pedobacter sp. AW31-3R]|uniref:RagB/SusD family nutrient uptake outer membrane protein n=1 Tax=Pedobacter sp. AW31-3R TaxID=3445781 RepID=UPI003FA15083